jgi:paraquat-inducible protein B
LRDNLRVVLRTSSLLTGQKELSLEYVPGARPIAETVEGDVWVLPSESDDLQDIGATLAQIADKLNHIPLMPTRSWRRCSKRRLHPSSSGP